MLAKCRLWMTRAQQPQSRSRCDGRRGRSGGWMRRPARAAGAAAERWPGCKRWSARRLGKPLHSPSHDPAADGLPRQAPSELGWARQGRSTARRAAACSSGCKRQWAQKPVADPTGAVREGATKERTPAKAGCEGCKVQLCGIRMHSGCAGRAAAPWGEALGMQYRAKRAADASWTPGSAEALAVPCTPARMSPAGCSIMLRR